MLYFNEPAIIVGKHQNTFAEINYWFVKENNIKVVRRLSGGGTVFHDPGNLNFCFIRNGKEGSLVDFHKFTQPIIEVLQKLGVNAERSGRNDLTVNELKFSGNAEHVYRNRTLHHGTLLFSSNLETISNALKIAPGKFQDKAVKSVRRKVTNLIDHLPQTIPIAEFRKIIMQHINTTFPEAKNYNFTAEDEKAIGQLMATRYSLWDWNFGYSPKFTFRNQSAIKGEFIEIDLEVDQGIIKQISIKANSGIVSDASEILINTSYKEATIQAKLQQLKHENANSWINLFF